MKKITCLLLLLSTISSFSQIKGLVTDENNVSLPSVTVLIEGTYNGTSTNEKGLYELNINKTGKYTIVFKCLGFKTRKIPVTIDAFPFELNAKLSEENFTLNEVVVSNKENPAYEVIRNAIKNRKENSTNSDKFEADFYSRGIFRAKGVPKKILGQEVTNKFQKQLQTNSLCC